MSRPTALAIGRARVLPPVGWWILLAALLALHLTLGIGAAAGVLVVVLLQIFLPFDFLTSYLLLVGAASIVNYSRGRLTAELSILSVVILFMLWSYFYTLRSRAFSLRRSPVTLPLVLYLGLSLINFARGMIVGNSPRYGGLEILSVLALASGLLVGNGRFDRRRIAALMAGLWVISLVHCGLGFYAFATLHVRTASIYFTPVPGVVAIVLFNFALRAPRGRDRWLIMAGILPLVAHQLLSFTRGYWLAMMCSVPFSIAVYGGRGAGMGARWRRAGRLLAGFVLVLALGGTLLATAYDISGLWQMAAVRLSSSTGTRMSFQTSSNVVRLVEYAHVLPDILRSPWFGHGLGYFFVVREPIHLKLLEQWWVHENYLLVWLKQGLVGLALFVATLIAALRTGLSGRHLPETRAASWCAGMAAATFFVLVYGFVHFPLAEVNTTFLVAFLWGGAIALTARDSWRLRWGGPRPE